MAEATWAEFTAALSDDDVALLTAFCDRVRRIPEVREEVHRSLVQWRRSRIFASAYVKSHWLEVSIDLLREAQHPELRRSFASTKRVTTHHLTFRSIDQLDAALDDLLREAAETVGPGTR